MVFTLYALSVIVPRIMDNPWSQKRLNCHLLMKRVAGDCWESSGYDWSRLQWYYIGEIVWMRIYVCVLACVHVYRVSESGHISLCDCVTLEKN